MIGRWTGRWTGRWHRVAAAPLAAAGIVAAALFAGSPAAAAEAARGMPAAGPVVVDDLGRTVQLAAPARRVVALTPALVELAFAAGGGDRLVAAVAFSDSPEAARALPRIGDAVNLDLERVLALAPDLILAWEGGTQPALLARVAALGVPVYSSRIERLDGIATTLERLATLFGLPAPASAATVRQRLAALPARGGIAGGGDSAASRSPVRVFYQVWERPLMTVNGRHVVSDLIGRCGGVNVFAALPALAPQVAVEAVVAAAPEVIVAPTARPDGTPDGSLAAWQRFPALPAVRHQALIQVGADALSRPAPRMLDAAEAICDALARVRRLPGR